LIRASDLKLDDARVMAIDYRQLLKDTIRGALVDQNWVAVPMGPGRVEDPNVELSIGREYKLAFAECLDEVIAEMAAARMPIRASDKDRILKELWSL
jgi:hypothetical protein